MDSVVFLLSLLILGFSPFLSQHFSIQRVDMPLAICTASIEKLTGKYLSSYFNLHFRLTQSFLSQTFLTIQH